MTAFAMKFSRLVDDEPTLSIPDDIDHVVCLPNINLKEQRKRLIMGIISFALAVGILIALLSSGANRLWRLPLFFLFAGAASGYFQAREKT